MKQSVVILAISVVLLLCLLSFCQGQQLKFCPVWVMDWGRCKKDGSYWCGLDMGAAAMPRDCKCHPRPPNQHVCECLNFCGFEFPPAPSPSPSPLIPFSTGS